jgi:hypothetical protein
MKKFIWHLKNEPLKTNIKYYWVEFLRCIGCCRKYDFETTNNLKPGEVGLNMTFKRLATNWYLFGIKIYTKKEFYGKEEGSK